MFDYTITVNRKHRYLVIGSPDFGFQVASACVGLGNVSAEGIGHAVLQVLANISQKLRELDLKGADHPEPIRTWTLRARKGLSTGRASKVLGVSRATLVKMAKSGEIEAHTTPGGHLRISLEGISDYMLRNNPAA